MSKIENGVLVIDSSVGHLQATATPDSTINVGESVSAIVSSDNIVLSETSKQLPNEVRCQVISEEFIGSVVTLYVETEQGVELKIQKQQRELDTLDIQIGKPLWASWQAKNIYLLAAT